MSKTRSACRLAGRVLAAALPGTIALAQEAPPGAATTALEELAPVEIKRKTNPGDVPYTTFYDIQTYLQSLLPPEPRMLDLSMRVNFTGMRAAERDAYQPASWAVAVVGREVDQVVPVRRGGYFLLPEVKLGFMERGTIMFNAQTRKGRMTMAWQVRVPETQKLAYAAFARAIEEAAIVQKQIPLYRVGLRRIRVNTHNSLRACYLAPGGRIEIDGRPVATKAEGACQVLRFDPAVAREGRPEIAFVGPLDIVTMWVEGENTDKGE